MEKIFAFGKIAFDGRAKINPVEVEIEIIKKGGEETFTVDRKTGKRTVVGKTPEYMEFTASGSIWNRSHTDIVCGGQCLDIIAEHRNEMTSPAVFDRIYTLWKKWHLNGAHAGTPEQESVVAEWKKAGNRYDFHTVCDMLKQRGLYEVAYTGPSVGRYYNNEPYRYGSAWLIQELPPDVIEEINQLLSIKTED